jgi:hypothetical protein
MMFAATGGGGAAGAGTGFECLASAGVEARFGLAIGHTFVC